MSQFKLQDRVLVNYARDGQRLCFTGTYLGPYSPVNNPADQGTKRTPADGKPWAHIAPDSFGLGSEFPKMLNVPEDWLVAVGLPEAPAAELTYHLRLAPYSALFHTEPFSRDMALVRLDTMTEPGEGFEVRCNGFPMGEIVVSDDLVLEVRMADGSLSDGADAAGALMEFDRMLAAE